MIVGDLGMGSVGHPYARVGHVAVRQEVAGLPVVQFHHAEQQVTGRPQGKFQLR